MRFGIDDNGWLYKLNLIDGTPALHIRPLPQNATEPHITPISAILHSQAATNQGSFQSAWNWWTSTASQGSEAHGVPNMDGQFMQFMSFDLQADCNFRGNGFMYAGKYSGAISFETQDLGSAQLPTTPWPPAQFETIAEVLAALHVHRGLALVRCPGPYLPGIGYHSQYPEWSKYVGKTCPGAARIAQMPALIARSLEIVQGDPIVIDPQPPIPVEDDDMKVYDIDKGTPKWARVVLIGGRFKWIRGAGNAVLEREIAAGRAPVADLSREEFRDLVRTLGSEGPSPWDPAQEYAVPGGDTALDFEWHAAARG